LMAAASPASPARNATTALADARLCIARNRAQQI
jgi:hypothetical protein